ncbi:MAG: hypothetical protein V3V20_02020 [Algisphaera sp.]
MNTMLAQVQINPGQWFGYLIFFLIFGLPIIRGLLGSGKKKGQNKGQRKTSGSARTRGASAPGRGGMPSRSRAQMGGGSGADSGAGLTMAERIARARQAQQGGGGAPAAPQRASRPSQGAAFKPVSGPASAGPSVASDQQRAAQLRRAEELRKRQQHEALDRRQKKIQRQKQREQAARDAARTQKAARVRAATAQADHYQEEHATHRLVKDVEPQVDLAAKQATASAAAAIDFGPEALRRAFVLKELLDAPIALRDDRAY